MTYEIVFLLDSKKADDGGEKFVGDVVKHVGSLGGDVKKRNSLGRKNFATPIRKRRSGLFWDFIVVMDPSKVETFKDKYRLDETVLRLEVFRAEEAKPKARVAAGS